MAKRILMVDDDVLLCRTVALNLERQGYAVQTVSTAEDALEQVQTHPPDLILLDISLPGMDGLEALRHFKQLVQAPIIFVSARRRQLDEVLGLDLGAEDYITKPFDMEVLLARIRTALRRDERGGVLTVGDLTIDLTARTVQRGQTPLDLPPREFQLLAVLASEPGKVFSVDELLTRVWGPEYAGDLHVAYARIRALREYLEEEPSNPRRLRTVRRGGYKLVP